LYTSRDELLLCTDWLKAAQAMAILALLVLVVALVTTILKLFVMKDKKPLLFAAIGSSFAGGNIRQFRV
jgi:hypothetical protein